MIFLDEIKDMKIYKKPFFAPINVDNKKKDSLYCKSEQMNDCQQKEGTFIVECSCELTKAGTPENLEIKVSFNSLSKNISHEIGKFSKYDIKNTSLIILLNQFLFWYIIGLSESKKSTIVNL